MRFWLSIIVLSLSTAGCASDVANRYYGTKTYSPVPQSQVAILRVKPARDFIVIADFQSRGETPEDMQKKAAQIGADAVLVTLLGGKYDQGDQWASQDSMSNTYSRIVGTAIKYK